jgi:FlaA1/EpsC-like NDP-sugar epimerase
VILRDTFRQCLTGAASVILFEYLRRMDLSRAFVGFFAAYAWILLCLVRLNSGRILRVLRREFGAAHYVMVAGLGEPARRLGRQLEGEAQYGVRLTGFLSDSTDPPTEVVELERRYPVHPLTKLPEMLRSDVIDEVIFAVDSRRLAELEEVFLLCDEEGVRTRVAASIRRDSPCCGNRYCSHTNSRPVMRARPTWRERPRCAGNRLAVRRR